uniref:Uncharacterized protein n=1 Tax=Meloidogyne enterolobii TaxID=390850 RepID=A0A6V7UEE3_MELEN|nr:unnamed protein product [Meloidogyne enterolobii]
MLIKNFFGIFILFLLFLNLTKIVDGVEIKLLEEEIESSKIPEESELTNFKVGEIDVPVNIEKNKNIQEKIIEEEKQSQKPNPGKASSSNLDRGKMIAEDIKGKNFFFIKSTTNLKFSLIDIMNKRIPEFFLS